MPLPEATSGTPLGALGLATPSPAQLPLPPLPQQQLSVPPHTESATPASEGLLVDPSLTDSDEHTAKRPRLEDAVDPEDEAVLRALAAHNQPDAVDNYAPE